MEPEPISARHGGLLDDELTRLGIDHDDVVDASVNVNPYGPSPHAERAIRLASISRYPDPSAYGARCVVAGALDVAPERVVVGNGAVELIWAAVRLLGKDKTLLVAEPAFSEARAAAVSVGARVVGVRAREENFFAFDRDAFANAVRLEKPRVAYIATPSNPTGGFVDLSVIRDLANEFPDTLFLADISFLSLSEQHATPIPPGSERVMWVRSLTKDLGIAGVRVGFAVAPPVIAGVIERNRPPWSVNALAQGVVRTAFDLETEAFVARTRTQLLADKMRLQVALRHLGMEVVPGQSVFVLAELPGARMAGPLRSRLLSEHRVLIRDATSFGLPSYVRIAALPQPKQSRVIEALRQELSS